MSACTDRDHSLVAAVTPGPNMWCCFHRWIAVHVIDFYNDISLLYGTVATVCTHETCPNMSAGTHRYLWADGVTFRTPVKVPAKEYVHYLMNWVDDQLSDESLFPTQEDAVFPEAFLPACKNIFRRLFRVYAHLYHHHFKQFAQLNLQQHLNVCFKRFMCVARLSCCGCGGVHDCRAPLVVCHPAGSNVLSLVCAR